MTNYMQRLVSRIFTHVFRDEGHWFWLIEKGPWHIEKSAGALHVWCGGRGVHIICGPSQHYRWSFSLDYENLTG